MSAHEYIKDFDEMRDTLICAMGYFGNREEDLRTLWRFLEEDAVTPPDGSPDYQHGWRDCVRYIGKKFDKLFPVPPTPKPPTHTQEIQDPLFTLKTAEYLLPDGTCLLPDGTCKFCGDHCQRWTPRSMNYKNLGIWILALTSGATTGILMLPIELVFWAIWRDPPGFVFRQFTDLRFLREVYPLHGEKR